MPNRRILVADDELPLRKLVVATVRNDARYEVIEARDGPEALSLVYRDKPDLVLLDVLMPGIDGFEVCRRIKSDPVTKGTTVIMLTALVQEADRKRGQEAGADGYFTKPFSPMALLNKITEILG